MEVYVRLAPEGLVARTDMRDGVFLHYAEDGRLVGVEVLQAASVDVDGVTVAEAPRGGVMGDVGEAE